MFFVQVLGFRIRRPEESFCNPEYLPRYDVLWPTLLEVRTCTVFFVPASFGRFRQRGGNAKTNWALNSASGLIDYRFSHEESLLAIPHPYDDQ